MKRKHIALLCLVTSAALTACTTTYKDTLDQKLVNKTEDQKRAVLAQECAQELKAGLKKDNPANVKHTEKMRKICEEMTGKKVSVE